MGLVPARRPGWLLEGRGNPAPRGMAAQSRRKRGTDRTRLTGPLAISFTRRDSRGAIARSKLTVAWRKQKRSDDWGFPRWRSYGARAATRRRCACATAKAAASRRPPRAQGAQQQGALVFLRSARRRIQQELELFRRAEPRGSGAPRGRGREGGNSGFRQSAQWKWGGPGDGTRSRDEMRALDALELEADADFKAVKAATGGWSRRITPTRTPAMPKPPSASSRSRRPTTSYARPRNGGTAKPALGMHERGSADKRSPGGLAGTVRAPRMNAIRLRQLGIRIGRDVSPCRQAADNRF